MQILAQNLFGLLLTFKAWDKAHLGPTHIWKQIVVVYWPLLQKIVL